jgi:hypothetical protein
MWRVTQGGQGKFSNDCRMSILTAVALTIFADINDPLPFEQIFVLSDYLLLVFISVSD